MTVFTLSGDAASIANRRTGGQRVAMRTSTSSTTTVNWIIGDHLGSTNVVANLDGTLLSRTLYKPWGEVRYQSGAIPTNYTYTGQYSHTVDFGLMFYNARWYDPSLGRFAQADSIVPGAGNPMAYDRYSYAYNNPLYYTDPSGHVPCELLGNPSDIQACNETSDLGGGDPTDPQTPPNDPTEAEMIEYINSFGITLQGTWTGTLLQNLWTALFTHIGYLRLKTWFNGQAVTLIWGGAGNNELGKYFGEVNDLSIEFTANQTSNPVINILHELGHLFDNVWNDYFTDVLKQTSFSQDGVSYGSNGSDYYSLPSKIVYEEALLTSPVGGGKAWQQAGPVPEYED